MHELIDDYINLFEFIRPTEIRQEFCKSSANEQREKKKIRTEDTLQGPRPAPDAMPQKILYECTYRPRGNPRMLLAAPAIGVLGSPFAAVQPLGFIMMRLYLPPEGTTANVVPPTLVFEYDNSTFHTWLGPDENLQLTDYEIMPDAGFTNPWQQPAAPGGKLTLNITRSPDEAGTNYLPMPPPEEGGFLDILKAMSPVADNCKTPDGPCLPYNVFLRPDDRSPASAANVMQAYYPQSKLCTIDSYQLNGKDCSL